MWGIVEEKENNLTIRIYIYMYTSVIPLVFLPSNF